MMNAFFEHVGINVADKAKTVNWYVTNIGLRVIRDVPGKMAFLADADGVVVLEVYQNPNAEMLRFEGADPLALHIGFEVEDPQVASEQLVTAGATIVDPIKQAGDDSMVMLRDPFGIAIQLVRRGARMRRG